MQGQPKGTCHYLMNVTIHRVMVTFALQGKSNIVKHYGNFDFIDYTTPLSEDDIFLTATSMFAEIFRRDEKGFYIGRPVSSRLNLTCRYVSVLVSSILKANGIPCRCRAGWATYISPNRILDHWVNEYWDAKQNRWVRIDLDDLYDQEFSPDSHYCKNGIATGYLDMQPQHYYTGAQAWQKYRQDNTFVNKLDYGSGSATPNNILEYLFFDFFNVMGCELTYTFMPIAFNKNIENLTSQQLKFVDNLAELMLDIDKNFAKLQHIWQTEPSVRMIGSPLVGADNYQALIDKNKYKF